MAIAPFSEGCAGYYTDRYSHYVVFCLSKGLGRSLNGLLANGRAHAQVNRQSALQVAVKFRLTDVGEGEHLGFIGLVLI